MKKKTGKKEGETQIENQTREQRRGRATLSCIACARVRSIIIAPVSETSIKTSINSPRGIASKPSAGRVKSSPPFPLEIHSPKRPPRYPPKLSPEDGVVGRPPPGRVSIPPSTSSLSLKIRDDVRCGVRPPGGGRAEVRARVRVRASVCVRQVRPEARTRSRTDAAVIVASRAEPMSHATARASRPGFVVVVVQVNVANERGKRRRTSKRERSRRRASARARAYSDLRVVIDIGGDLARRRAMFASPPTYGCAR